MVQHHSNGSDKWTDNYYFTLEPVDYAKSFAAVLKKHYDSRDHFGPFLTGFRFNMWSEATGLLIRDHTALVFSSPSQPPEINTISNNSKYSPMALK